MLRKLISESYWLENSQLDEIYNFGFNDCSWRFCFFYIFHFCVEFHRHWEKKLDVGDFKLASISGITGSQIHCISPGRLLADRSRWELSGKNTAPHDWSMIGLWPRQVPTSKTHIEWALAILMMSYIGKGDKIYIHISSRNLQKCRKTNRTHAKQM